MLNDKSFQPVKCRMFVISYMFLMNLCFLKMGKTCVSFDHSNNLLAGGRNGLIHTWDLKNRNVKNTYEVCCGIFLILTKVYLNVLFSQSCNTS